MKLDGQRRTSSLLLLVCFALVVSCMAQDPDATAPAAVTAADRRPAPVKETTGSPDALLASQPLPGAAIPVSTTLTAPAAKVVLVWRIDFQPEKRVPFPQPPGATKLTVSIPAGVTKPGSLVRWAVEVTAGTILSRDPVMKSNDSTAYWGTVVPNPATASPGKLPVMEWFTQDERNVTLQAGAACSVFFDRQLYDNVECGRKGVTSLAWPKPKLKINFHKDNGFVFPGTDLPPQDRIDLSSNFREPGQNSYMRETVAYELMRAAGVPALHTAWVSLNINNKYYGFFSILSKINVDYLKDNDLDPEAGVYKAVNGINSNLRWGSPATDLQYYYTLEGVLNDKYKKDLVLLNSTAPGTPYGQLQDLIEGINGGGPELRSRFAFDFLNLPAVVNEMAVQTAMLAQDRCTKNYYIYHDPVTQMWQRLPYDLKSTFSTDRGFNGMPAKDYCILACAQWNSPLYCSGPEYAQDLSDTTPWAVITPQFGTFSGGRRLLQGGQSVSAASQPNATVDVDLTTSTPIQGANGTFNYLIKLIVDVPETRQMYLRRLRTIADTYLNGFVEDAFTNNYNKIAADAAKDNDKWNGGDPALGFKQMIEETLPLRKEQLFKQYGPGGKPPLVPAAQAAMVVLRPGVSDGTGDEAFLEILNPQAVAIDVSGFKVQGAASFTFPPGTVIPAKSGVFVVPNVAAFRQRAQSPKGNEGRFVVGPATGDVTGIVSLQDAKGKAVSPQPVLDSGAATESGKQ